MRARGPPPCRRRAGPGATRHGPPAALGGGRGGRCRPSHAAFRALRLGDLLRDWILTTPRAPQTPSHLPSAVSPLPLPVFLPDAVCSPRGAARMWLRRPACPPAIGTRRCHKSSGSPTCSGRCGRCSEIPPQAAYVVWRPLWPLGDNTAVPRLAYFTGGGARARAWAVARGRAHWLEPEHCRSKR